MISNSFFLKSVLKTVNKYQFSGHIFFKFRISRENDAHICQKRENFLIPIFFLLLSIKWHVQVQNLWLMLEEFHVKAQIFSHNKKSVKLTRNHFLTLIKIMVLLKCTNFFYMKTLKIIFLVDFTEFLLKRINASFHDFYVHVFFTWNQFMTNKIKRIVIFFV